MTDQEINEAVAKKLGWHPDTVSHFNSGGLCRTSPPDYCHSIEAAWAIVEHLHAKGGCQSLITDDFGHWAFVGDGMQPAEEKFEGQTTFFIDDKDLWADTAPMAICKAFLKLP